MHTYSARPEHPGVAFSSRAHDRDHYQTSHGTERRDRERDRDRDREAYQPDHYRPAHADVRARTTSKPSTRTNDDGGKPSRTVTTSEKPRAADKTIATDKPRTTVKDRDKSDEHVTLAPSKPEKTPRKRAHILSFRERVKLLAKEKNEEVARQERERRTRMSKVIGAAAAEND